MRDSAVEQRELIRLWTRVVLRVLVILALSAAALWLLFTLGTVLLLLVLSIFFCYMVAPVVRLFEQPVYIAGREIRMPRGLAIAFVYAALGAVLYVGLKLLAPLLWQQVTELAQNLPRYIAAATAGINRALNSADGWASHLNLPHEWRAYLLAQASHLGDAIFPWLQSAVVGGFGYLPFLTWLVLVPVLSFFLLRDANRFMDLAVALMPNERLRKRAYWLLLDVSKTMAAYIRAQVTACLVIGAVTTVGFSLLGVPYAIVLGAASAVLEFIPLVGPLTAALIACGLSLTVSVNLALAVAVFLLVLRGVQDYAIYPRIIGHGIKMHPLVVVLAILAGAEIGGVSGIFLAIPVIALLIVVYNHYLAYRGLRELAEGTSEREAAGEELDGEPSLKATGAPARIE